MKYKSYGTAVEQGNRKTTNISVLELIEKTPCENQIFQNISRSDLANRQEQVYNTYTGVGGLHDLDWNDFNNYHEYSIAKKAREQGQFFTPHSICEIIVDIISPNPADKIADLTFGMGNFFNFCPTEENCYGSELDYDAYQVANFLYPKANLVYGDILHYQPRTADNLSLKFDIILGNPPFNLDWQTPQGKMSSQRFYFTKAFDLLKEGGLMAVIVPKTYLTDDFFEKKEIDWVNQKFTYIANYDFPHNTFKHLGVNSFPTKVMFFAKKHLYIPHQNISFWENKQSPEEIKTKISVIKSIIKENKFRFFRENTPINSNNFSRSNEFHNKGYGWERIVKDVDNKFQFEKIKVSTPFEGFEFVLKKYLYELKAHENTRKHLKKCLEYIEKYQTQIKPQYMNNVEWDSLRITEKKVLDFMKRRLKTKPKKKEGTIKTNYGIALQEIGAEGEALKSKYRTFTVLIDSFPQIDFSKKPKWIKKLLQKKYNFRQKITEPFSEITPSKEVFDFVENFTFRNAKGEHNFTQIQKEDATKFLMKPYGLANWHMGTGKTPLGYAVSKYRLGNGLVKNVFIVAPAIAIDSTWLDFMQCNNEPFIKIKKVTDIDRIKEGMFVLITQNKIIEKIIYRALRKFVKKQNQKVMLLFDESDNAKNPHSLRTKAIKAVFRKAKYKFCTTGTATLNDIAELYSQLELLYNNSYTMPNECEEMYHLDKKSNKISVFKNPKIGLPYSAKHGNGDFKACFNPLKATVFGVEKKDQNVYNEQHLLKIISQSMITRAFEEISGKDKYSIVSHKVVMTDCEKKIYEKILTDFIPLIPMFYATTGNQQKDAYLRIIQQINLLIKACSLPQRFPEFTDEVPTKFLKVQNLVKTHQEKVAIGCTTIEAANAYYAFLKRHNTGRLVFLITGEKSVKQRKSIVKYFEDTPDGILISTQQSLSSSINIPSCTQVIIETLQWNDPKMAQYYFRFIRFDSEKHTTVHFVNYADSIEMNIMALIIDKESLNNFVKTGELGKDKIMQKMNLDVSFFEQVIQSVKDADGRVQLRFSAKKESVEN